MNGKFYILFLILTFLGLNCFSQDTNNVNKFNLKRLELNNQKFLLNQYVKDPISFKQNEVFTNSIFNDFSVSLNVHPNPTMVVMDVPSSLALNNNILNQMKLEILQWTYGLKFFIGNIKNNPKTTFNRLVTPTFTFKL